MGLYLREVVYCGTVALLMLRKQASIIYDLISFNLSTKQDLKTMEQQKKTIENEHLSSLEKLKEREEEIRQLHKVMIEAVIKPSNAWMR